MRVHRAMETVSIDVVDTTVVVTIPPDVEVNRAVARNINREFFEQLYENHVSSSLTAIAAGATFNEGALDEVNRAAACCYQLGIRDWAVVTTDASTATRFCSRLPGIETAHFETVSEAVGWLPGTGPARAVVADKHTA
jgi:hypothetical protein